VMVTGGIVSYDPGSSRYTFPPITPPASRRRSLRQHRRICPARRPARPGAGQGAGAASRQARGPAMATIPASTRSWPRTANQTVAAALFDHILPLVLGDRGAARRDRRAWTPAAAGGSALIEMAKTFPEEPLYRLRPLPDAIDWARLGGATGRRGERGLRGARPDRLPRAGRFDLDHVVRRRP
jgi:hypothetical protein